MLRLVHPAPQGKESARQKYRRSAALTPTPEEQQRIRAAIKNISRAYGGRDALAAVMGISEVSLKLADRKSYSFAVLLARAAGISVEQLLTGKPHEVGACPFCGRKGAR
jgi:hypothetical protein